MYTLEQLAKHVNGKIIGNPNQIIRWFAPAEKAGKEEITFLASRKHLPDVLSSNASCVIVPKPIKESDKNQLVVAHPYYAFVQIIQLFQKKTAPSGISSKAEISNHVQIGENPSIGPFVFIDEGVIVGSRVILYPGVYIGKGTRIGDDTRIYSHVSINENTRIGNKVIIHSGTVIGGDGFGFVTVEGTHHKIPHLGIVVIEDDVELGANVTIDRATFGETRIKKGTKMDDQVHIGHNTIIGENSLFAAQVGVSGSVKIGDHAMIGGQAGFAGHIEIGNHVKIAARAGVINNIDDHQTVAGFPAVPHVQWKRSVISLKDLAKLQKKINDMEDLIQKLEKKRQKH